MARILVVDDEELLRELVSDTLTMGGHSCTMQNDARVALEVVDELDPDLVISDFKMPGMTGLEFLRELRRKRPQQAFLLMTAFGTIEMAVEAMRSGASDFLEKPFGPDMLDHRVGVVLESIRMRRENQSLRRQLRGHTFVGEGGIYQNLQKFVSEVAPSHATVLITGESGVGKEVLARAVHGSSLRSLGPFVKVNCAAMPENLIESELFGHEKGAFTGALKTRKGKFEQAHCGSLLLDEIGEMPLAAQAKLLRVLQEREVSRVGSDEEIRVDVRVICTTNRDLKREVEEGRFREDLYYRLSVVPIDIPPLRDRVEDLPGLIEHFIDRFNGENGYTVDGVAPEAMIALQAQRWPGNIRQLENAVERAMVFRKSGLLQMVDFDLGSAPRRSEAKPGDVVLQAGMTVAQAEQMLIMKTLEECTGNKTKASEMLDISIRTLRNKLHEYGATQWIKGHDED